jgi:hypothetical protein
VGNVYAGTYESHPVAIKKHKMDGSMMDAKALLEFEIEVRAARRAEYLRVCMMDAKALEIVAHAARARDSARQQPGRQRVACFSGWVSARSSLFSGRTSSARRGCW